MRKLKFLLSLLCLMVVTAVGFAQNDVKTVTLNLATSGAVKWDPSVPAYQSSSSASSDYSFVGTMTSGNDVFGVTLGAKKKETLDNSGRWGLYVQNNYGLVAHWNNAEAYMTLTAPKGYAITGIKYGTNVNLSSLNLYIDKGATGYPAMTEANNVCKTVAGENKRAWVADQSDVDANPQNYASLNLTIQNAKASGNIAISEIEITLQDIRPMATISFENVVSNEITIKATETFRPEFLTNPEGLAVSLLKNSDSSYASYSNGVITGLTPGRTVLTFQTEKTDDYRVGTVDLVVNVEEAPPGLYAPVLTSDRYNGAIWDNSQKLYVGDVLRLSTVTEGAELSYRLAGGALTTYNPETGIVLTSATNGASSFVAIASKDGKQESTTYTGFSVSKKRASLSFQADKLELYVGETGKVGLDVVTTPEGETNYPAVSYAVESVEGDNVASVDKNGNVTALNPGKAKITAKINGNNTWETSEVVFYTVVSKEQPYNYTFDFVNNSYGLERNATKTMTNISVNAANIKADFTSGVANKLRFSTNGVRFDANSNGTIKLTSPKGYVFKTIKFNTTAFASLQPTAGVIENGLWTAPRNASNVTFAFNPDEISEIKAIEVVLADPDTRVPAVIAVAKITKVGTDEEVVLNNGNYEIEAGEKYNITFTPSDLPLNVITGTSNATNVVSYANGVITGVTADAAAKQITFTSVDCEKYLATTKGTVVKFVVKPSSKLVAPIVSLNRYEGAWHTEDQVAFVGDVITLTNPNSEENPSELYYNLNGVEKKYTEEGIVLDKAQDYTFFAIAKSTVNSSNTAQSESMTFTVVKKSAVLAFASKKLTLYMNEGQTSGNVALNVTTTPEGEIPTVTYTSTNSSVATVDAEGNVTAVGVGTATIRATVATSTVWNNASATYSVEVKNQPTEVLLSSFATNEYGLVADVNGLMSDKFTATSDNVKIDFTVNAAQKVRKASNLIFLGGSNGTITVNTPDIVTLNNETYVLDKVEFGGTVSDYITLQNGAAGELNGAVWNAGFNTKSVTFNYSAPSTININLASIKVTLRKFDSREAVKFVAKVFNGEEEIEAVDGVINITAGEKYAVKFVGEGAAEGKVLDVTGISSNSDFASYAKGSNGEGVITAIKATVENEPVEFTFNAAENAEGWLAGSTSIKVAVAKSDNLIAPVLYTSRYAGSWNIDENHPFYVGDKLMLSNPNDESIAALYYRLDGKMEVEGAMEFPAEGIAFDEAADNVQFVAIAKSLDGNEDKIELHEFAVIKKTAILSFAPETLDLYIGSNGNVALNVTTVPEGEDFSLENVEYSVDGESITFENGVVTAEFEGESVIKAEFAGSDAWNVASAEMIVNVKAQENDVTFDFRSNNYGLVRETSSTPVSFTVASNNVKINFAGMTSARLAQNGGLRVAKINASMNVVAPEGYVIRSVAFGGTAAEYVSLSGNNGSFANATWNGYAESVNFALNTTNATSATSMLDTLVVELEAVGVVPSNKLVAPVVSTERYVGKLNPAAETTLYVGDKISLECGYAAAELTYQIDGAAAEAYNAENGIVLTSAGYHTVTAIASADGKSESVTFTVNAVKKSAKVSYENADVDYIIGLHKTGSKKLNIVVEQVIENALPLEVAVETIPVAYTSGDETIATVDNSGVVTGIAYGNTVITATIDSNEWATVEASYNIEVKDAVVYDFTTDSYGQNRNVNLTKVFTMTNGEVTATVNPMNAQAKNVKFTDNALQFPANTCTSQIKFNAPEGYVIKEVVFNGNSNVANALSYRGDLVQNGMWTGKKNEVIFNINHASAEVIFQNIVVTYEEGEEDKAHVVITYNGNAYEGNETDGVYLTVSAGAEMTLSMTMDENADLFYVSGYGKHDSADPNYRETIEKYISDDIFTIEKVGNWVVTIIAWDEQENEIAQNVFHIMVTDGEVSETTSSFVLDFSQNSYGMKSSQDELPGHMTWIPNFTAEGTSALDFFVHADHYLQSVKLNKAEDAGTQGVGMTSGGKFTVGLNHYGLTITSITFEGENLHHLNVTDAKGNSATKSGDSNSCTFTLSDVNNHNYFAVSHGGSAAQAPAKRVMRRAVGSDEAHITKVTVNTKASIPTVIEEISADDAEVIYFDLQGRRVEAENLVPGIYVRVQGTQTSKVLVK